MSAEDQATTKVDITEKQDGGVLKEIKVAGTGDNSPSTGDSVSVHYVGTLEDGTVFDSSRDRNEYFVFNLGKREVISAWDIGVASMKKGETCILTCKSEYAYGKNGSPPKIGPDATLIFEVELFSWQGEDISEKKDKSVCKSIITAGDSFNSPQMYSAVTIEYSKHEDGVKGEMVYLKFILGEGRDHSIPHGLERALTKMTKGEVALVTIDYPGLMQTMEYTIKLKLFEIIKDQFDMILSEKLARGQELKLRANTHFSQQKYLLSTNYYMHIVKLCEESCSKSDETEEDKVSLAALIVSCRLNAAMCHLKLECFADCSDCCDKVLESDSNNVKALFRRGMARKSMSMFDKSIEDFRACLAADAKNSAARNQLNSALKLRHDHVQAEKNMYSNMFRNLSKATDQVPENKAEGDVKTT